jgi:magnesium-transporting ATPase (P-type)
MPWHTRTHEEVQQALQTGPDGLSDAEASRRLARHGPNRLAPPRRRGALLRLLMQFHDILLYVMLGAAVITAFVGRWVDTAVLLAAVLINALIGFVQEGKAEASLRCFRPGQPRAQAAPGAGAAGRRPGGVDDRRWREQTWGLRFGPSLVSA